MTTRSNSRKNTTLFEVRSLDKGEKHYEQYRIGNQLGKGGFANVYEICKVHQKFQNAVKIILKTDKHGKLDPYILEKVKSEVSLMKAAALNNEGVVQYRHHFGDGSATYIIMEFCPLGDLSSMMKKRKTLTQPEIRFFMAQLVPILVKLKESNIIHRDIKPGNLFLTKQMRLKLGDFGLATFNDQNFRKKMNVCGTPNYLAPEVLERRGYSFQVDLWAIGIIMYTMLMGIPPFEAKTCNETYQNIKKCQVKYKAHYPISQEAKMLIGQILKRDPKKRISLDKIMSHPFMSNFRIPDKLQTEWMSIPPPPHFIKKYSRKISVKKQSVDDLSLKLQSINVSLTRLDRPKTINIEAIKSASKKDSSLKKEKHQYRATYRYCPRRDVQQIHQDILVTPQKKVEIKKEEQCMNKDVDHTLSRLETSVSLKKRAKTSTDEEFQPQKKFKFNFQPIEEQTIKKEQEGSRPLFKIYPLQPQIQTLYPSPFLKEDDLAKMILEAYKTKICGPSELQARYSNFRRKSLQYDDINKQDMLQQKKMVWYQITKNNDLVYQLNSKQWGICFADGSQILRSNPHKIKYISSTGQNSDGNILHHAKYYKKLALLTDYRLKIGNKVQKNIQLQCADDVHIDSYTKVGSILIIKYSNNNIHFLMEEGHEILVNLREQYILYENMEKSQHYKLPLTQLINTQSTFVNNYMAALKGFYEATKSHIHYFPISTVDKLSCMRDERWRGWLPTQLREEVCVGQSGKSIWE